MERLQSNEHPSMLFRIQYFELSVPDSAELGSTKELRILLTSTTNEEQQNLQTLRH